MRTSSTANLQSYTKKNSSLANDWKPLNLRIKLRNKLDKIIDMIEHENFELETFDNVLIRKLIECVKVLSKTEILVIFKGGYEVKAEIE